MAAVASADKRARNRAVKQEGPRWPLAYELAALGTPIGVWLVPLVGGVDLCAAVTTDLSGQLVELRRLERGYLVRWCLNRHLRICYTLGELVEGQTCGRLLGWLPGRILEVKNRRAFVAPAIAFHCTLPGEAHVPGAVVIGQAVT